MLLMNNIVVMKKIVCFINVLLVLLCTACSTINTLSFERLEAADISFPETIRKVGVVNNIPIMQGTEQDMAQAAGILEGDGKVMAEALAQEMAATHYFDEIVVCDSALCPLTVSLKNREGLKEEWQGHVLSPSVVDEWIGNLGVDMLVAVERARIELKSDVALSDFGGVVPVVDGIITPMARIYVPHRDKPILAITKTDTIFWHVTTPLTFGKIVKESSEYAASVLVSYLIPYWKEVSRNYYDGGSVEMRDAGVYLREGDWEEAFVLWKKVYDTQKGMRKMRAAYNLALYSEMQNDYGKAKEYLEVAAGLVKKNSADAVLVRSYRKLLDLGADKNQKLLIQMKRFDDKN